MKKQDRQKLAALSVAELQQKEQALRVSLTEARMNKAVGRLTDRKQVSKLSDDVARVMTVRRQKEMEAAV